MAKLIIDGNSIGHAAHNGARLTVGDMQTQAIFGVLKSVRVLKEKFSDLTTLVLWDGEAKWRKDIYPEYKANRVARDAKQLESKEAYKQQSPFVRKVLSLVGVTQMLATTHEADDLAGMLVKRRQPGERIVLVTGDQDWLTLMAPGVSWYDPIRDNLVLHGDFTNFTGYFSPHEFLQGKALRGDTSDNIPGVGGIGEKGAPEFLAQFKSVENFWAMCDSGEFVPKKVAHKNLNGACPHTKDEWAELFVGDRGGKDFAKHMDAWPGQGRIIFPRNMRLMNLLDAPEPKREDIHIIKPTYNEANFRTFCERLAFRSILLDLDGFLRPFKPKVEQLAA